MCCGLGPRGLLILISCWAILQSIIYLVFSVIGILISNCNHSMTDNKFNYLLYLAYFRDESCGPIDWSILGLPAQDISVSQPGITTVVIRTGAFLYAYLALSTVWIVTSMSLIVSTFTPCMSQLCLKVFSFPWVVTCIGVLVLDVIATVYHIIDITNTTNITAFLNFLEIINVEQVQSYFTEVPEYLLPLPAITMMLVSIRGVLLWAVNLSCLVYVIRAVKKMLRNELMKNKKVVRPDFGYEREFNRTELPQQSNHRNEDQPQMTELSRYNDASVSNQYQYDNNGFQPEPVQSAGGVVPNSRYVAAGGNYVFVSEKRYLEPLKGGIPPRSEDGMSSRASNSRSLDSVEDASRASSNIGSRSHTSSTDRTLELDNELVVSPTGQRLSYLSEDSMFSDNNNNRRSNNGPPPILVKPSMIKQQQQTPQSNQHPQYMRQHQQIREEDVRTSYQTPPEELRSQLPWSYFQDRDDTTRPQKQRYDDELLPPVPVPDYTLHFPKKERPPTKPKPQRPEGNTNDPNERWSGPEYTY